MKLLQWTAILGFGCWGISEVLEIIQGGHTPFVYYLTATYHLLAAIGIWGLYRKQTAGKDTFNTISVVVPSIAYLALVFFPIQLMNSGLAMRDFLDNHPFYKIVGFVWFIGMVLFSISIIRTNYFPKWSGIVILLGTIAFTAIPLIGWPSVVVNITNILFAATVIYISAKTLKTAPV